MFLKQKDRASNRGLWELALVVGNWEPNPKAISQKTQLGLLLGPERGSPAEQGGQVMAGRCAATPTAGESR